MYVTKPLPFWPFKEVDVDGIRPRQVQVYLLGSEMGDANLEIAKTILACWGKLLLFTSVPVILSLAHPCAYISVNKIAHYERGRPAVLLYMFGQFQLHGTISNLGRVFTLFTWLMQ